MDPKKLELRNKAKFVFTHIPTSGTYVDGTLFWDKESGEWVVVNEQEKVSFRKASKNKEDKIKGGNFDRDFQILQIALNHLHPELDEDGLPDLNDGVGETRTREGVRKVLPVGDVEREGVKEGKSTHTPSENKGKAPLVNATKQGKRQRRFEAMQDEVFLKSESLKNLPTSPAHTATLLISKSVDSMKAEEIEEIEIRQPHRKGIREGYIEVRFFEYRNRVDCPKCGAVRFVKDQDVKQVKFCAECIQEERKMRRRKK